MLGTVTNANSSTNNNKNNNANTHFGNNVNVQRNQNTTQNGSNQQTLTETAKNQFLPATNLSMNAINDILLSSDASILSSREQQNIYYNIYRNLLISSQVDDAKFALEINQLSPDEQFIFTMQRWAYQIYEIEKNIQILSGHRKYHQTQSQFERIRLPIGCYIHSSKTNNYYLNLGIEAKTLQGCIYIGYEYPGQAFIDEVLLEMASNNYQSPPNYAKLIGKYSCKPTVAIKYYDKACIDASTSLSGLPVKEKPIQEIKITKLLYKTAKNNEKLNKPLLPWLQSPYKNIIKLIDSWQDYEKNALFMVTGLSFLGNLPCNTTQTALYFGKQNAKRN